MLDLTRYLPSVGVDLTGWKLGLAYGISDDGTAITGDGIFEGHPRGWIVTGPPVPEPGAMSVLALGALLVAVATDSRNQFSVTWKNRDQEVGTTHPRISHLYGMG